MGYCNRKMPAPEAPIADPALKVETPERVELSLDVAGLGTRALSYLVDFLVLFLLWTTVALASSLFNRQGVSLDDLYALRSLVKAALGLAVFAVHWGYWVLFETLWSGRSPGKRLLRIRAVRLDGSPAGFPEAALRSLGRVVDFLPVLYAVGLASMIANPRSRRLGDLLAGTVVVRERRASLERYLPGPPGQAAPGLSLEPAELELVTGFLARADQLSPEARERVAVRIAEPLARRLSPDKQAVALAGARQAEAFLRSLVQGDG